MNARAFPVRPRHRTGSLRRAVCVLTLVAMAATSLAAPAPQGDGSQRPAISEANGREAVTDAGPASPWDEAARRLILDEAVDRLPEPLRGLFATPTHRERLREAVAAPARPAAETAEAVETLADALAGGGPDAVFAAAARLARPAIALHLPLAAVEDSEALRTGHHGVAGAVGVGLIARYGDFYANAIREGRRPVRYLDAPADALATWTAAARERVAPILEADAVARREATYNPAQHPEDLTALDAAAARAYYEALRRELGRRGSPEAAALRDAAAHLSDLVYTAWVRAGKPLSLQAADAASTTDDRTSPYWLLVLAAVTLAVLLWPRRRAGANRD